MYQLCACKYYSLFTIIFLLEHVFKFYRHFQINVFYKRQLENDILLRNIAPSLRLSSIFLKKQATVVCVVCIPVVFHFDLIMIIILLYTLYKNILLCVIEISKSGEGDEIIHFGIKKNETTDRSRARFYNGYFSLDFSDSSLNLILPAIYILYYDDTVLYFIGSR